MAAPAYMASSIIGGRPLLCGPPLRCAGHRGRCLAVPGERGVVPERRGSGMGRGDPHLLDALPLIIAWGVGVHMPWLGVKGTVRDGQTM